MVLNKLKQFQINPVKKKSNPYSCNVLLKYSTDKIYVEIQQMFILLRNGENFSCKNMTLFWSYQYQKLVSKLRAQLQKRTLNTLKYRHLHGFSVCLLLQLNYQVVRLFTQKLLYNRIDRHVTDVALNKVSVNTWIWIHCGDAFSYMIKPVVQFATCLSNIEHSITTCMSKEIHCQSE